MSDAQRGPDAGRPVSGPLAFVTDAGEAGQRLDVVLARRTGLSRSTVARLVVEGLATVDGAPARKSHVVRAGETVVCALPAPRRATLVPEPVPLRVVYEDDWLLVVDKPAGVVVHPAPGHERGTLVQGLLARGIGGGHELRPGVVHRLDRETSGLLVVARHEDAHRRLVAAMGHRAIERVYVALVVGDLPQEEGTVDAAIGRHLRERRRLSVHAARPRPAVTHFRVLGRVPGFTLLEVRLETGRTHQIRVHMAAVGHPVAGDATYGGRPRPAGLGRHFLHAARLALPHPDDGHRLCFAAPLPADLAAFLDGLGLGATLPPDLRAAQPPAGT